MGIVGLYLFIDQIAGIDESNASQRIFFHISPHFSSNFRFMSPPAPRHPATHLAPDVSAANRDGGAGPGLKPPASEVDDTPRPPWIGRALLAAFPFLAAGFVSSCGPPSPPPASSDRIDSPGLPELSDSTPVRVVLRSLGAPLPYEPDSESTAPAWVEAGRDLYRIGRAEHPETGARGRPLAPRFRCTDCHLAEREQPDLASTPTATELLAYAIENDLPLLPGSSLAGVTDRASWFNGDYALEFRFSDDVMEARSDLPSAVRLCLSEMARAREPEPWEFEALLAYLASLEWRLGDLGLTETDYAELRREALEPAAWPSIARQLRDRYPRRAPATFGEPPRDLARGYHLGIEPNPDLGGEVWRRSCLHCHGPDGVSEHHFAERPATWHRLSDAFAPEGEPSLYHLLRHGTPRDAAVPSHKPRYPVERLGAEQIESLRTFLRLQGEDRAAPPAALSSPDSAP